MRTARSTYPARSAGPGAGSHRGCTRIAAAEFQNTSILRYIQRHDGGTRLDPADEMRRISPAFSPNTACQAAPVLSFSIPGYTGFPMPTAISARPTSSRPTPRSCHRPTWRNWPGSTGLTEARRRLRRAHRIHELRHLALQPVALVRERPGGREHFRRRAAGL
jgi:hypothetical protein